MFPYNRMLPVDCPWFSLACGSYAPDLGYGTCSMETSTHEVRFTCLHMYGLHIRINIIIHSSPVHNLFMNCSYVVHDLVWMFVRWVLLLDPNSWFVSVAPMQHGSLCIPFIHTSTFDKQHCNESFIWPGSRELDCHLASYMCHSVCFVAELACRLMAKMQPL